MVDFKRKSDELKARLRKNVQEVQPDGDMNFKPPPPKEKEEIPELRDVIANPAERLKVQRLIQSYVLLQAESSQLEASKKALSTQIKSIMGKNEVAKCSYDGTRLAYFPVTRPGKLNPQMLLARGVSPLVIKQCTEEDKTSYQLKITPPGAKESEE